MSVASHRVLSRRDPAAGGIVAARRTRRGILRRWPLVQVLAALACWAVLTWPWPLRMWTHVPGGDGAGFVWGFWWMRTALGSAAWPLTTDHLFAPMGTNLAFHTLMPLPAAVSVPLQLLLGAPLAYNLVGVAALTLAALCAAALARDLGLSRGPALVAGLLFLAAPSVVDRYAVLEHLNLAMVFWIPLLVLVVRRCWRAPSRRRGALVGLVGAGALWTDLTIAVFAGIAAGGWLLVAVVALLRRGAARGDAALSRRVAAGGVAAAVAAVAVLPLAVSMIAAAASGDVALDIGLAGAPRFSADLAGLWIGDARNPLLGDVGEAWRAQLGGRRDGANDLGAVITLVAVAGAATAWRRGRRATVVGLVGLAVVAVWLSLGPALLVAGERLVPLPVAEGDDVVSALMPYTWVRRLPLLSGLRAPGRFALLAALPLALLAGHALQAVPASRRALVAAVIVPLALVEAASPVDDLLPAVAPAPVWSIAADPRPGGIVVDVPLGWRNGFGQVGRWSDAGALAATAHGRMLASGFVARLRDERIEALADLPLYRDLVALQDTEAGAAQPTVDASAGAASARAADVRWVVVDRSIPGVSAVRSYLRAACFGLLDEDASVEVYRSAVPATACAGATAGTGLPG